MVGSDYLDFVLRRWAQLGAVLLCGGALLISGCDAGNEANAEQHLKRATDYREQGDLRAAVIEFKNALQKEPDNANARFQLGQIYVALGDAGAAAKELERARELGYESTELTIQFLEALLLQGNFQTVLATLEQMEGAKADPKLLMLRGRAQLGLGQLNEAEEAFQTILKAAPASTDARLGLARVAVANLDLGEAEAQADLALEAAGDNVQAWLLKGELALAREQFAEAEAAFQSAFALTEANVPARIGLARAFLGLNQTEKARKQIDALSAINADAPIVNYLKALLARQEGDLQATERALREVLAVVPNHPQSLLLLGAIQLGKGEQAQSEELLTRFISRNPGNPAGTKLLASLYQRQNRPQAAIDLLLKAERRAPDDTELLVLLGNAYIRQGNIETGREYLARAVELAPDSPALRAQLAAGHLVAGATDEAVAELESVIEQRPDFARADLLLVLTHLRTRDFELAFQAARALSEKHPESGLPHNLMGAAREAQQKKDEARLHYEKALEIQPDYTAAALNMARMDYQSGAIESARRRYEEILDEHENHPTALLAMARLLAQEGRTAEAVSYLEQARRAHPPFLAPRLMLAEYYLQSGQVRNALAVVEEAQQIAAEDPRVLFYLGRAQLFSGEIEEALTAFEKLAERAPESPQAHLQLGLAQMRAGEAEGAQASLERALALKGDSLQAKAALGSLALSQGQIDEALNYAHLIKEQHPEAVAGDILEGDAYMAKGAPAQAAKMYQRALERTQSSRLIVKLHTAKARSGDIEGGLATLRERLAERPDDVLVRLTLASTLHLRGERDAAIKEYERVLNDQPQSAVALNNLAWLYHEHSDPRGLGLAEKAHGLAPKSPEIADTYGWLLIQNDKVEQGLKLLRQASREAPNNADIRYHLAAGLAKAGDREGARRELEALLRTDEKFTERAKAERLLELLK